MRTARLSPFMLVGVTLLGCSSPPRTVPHDDAGPPKDSGWANRHVVARNSSTAEKDARSDVRAKPRPDVEVSPAPDAGDAGDAAQPGYDAGLPPTPEGTTIDTGPDFAIQGVTDDGYVIYTTRAAVKAAPVAGGATVLIAEMGDAAAGMVGAMVVHDDVFAWSNIDPTSFAGVLTLWNHTASIHEQLSTSSQAFLAAASADSSAVMYTDASSADGTAASLVGAKTTSLASPSVLATSVDTSGDGCNPVLAFTATSSPFHAIASFCIFAGSGDAAADGPNSVYAYPSTTWAPVTLAASATSFWTDSVGASVAVLLKNGALEVVPLGVDGGSPVVLGVADAETVTGAFLSAKDVFALYDTSEGALVRSPVGTWKPTTLFSKGVASIDRVSPSETFALVSSGTDPSTGLPTDLAIASTSKAGAAAILTGTTPTLAGVLGDAFTADPSSTHAIYITGVSVDGSGNAIGTLQAVEATTPGTIIPLATTAVSAFNGTSYTRADLALSGTRISFTDHFDATRNNYGSVDLRVVDLATTTPSTTVMMGADPGYAVSFDRQHILYTITFGSSTDGIYSVAAP